MDVWHKRSIAVMKECMKNVLHVEVKVPFGRGKFLINRLYSDTNMHIRRIQRKGKFRYMEAPIVCVTINRNNTIVKPEFPITS